MAKIRCTCDEGISTVSVPNPSGFLLLSEPALDAIENTAGTKEMSVIVDEINDGAVQGYRCPRCSQLLLFESGRAGPVTYYRKVQLPDAESRQG
jgi:hypothetical protein